MTGLIAARLTKPKKMKARHSRYWTEISCERYLFNRDEIETDHVKTITQSQLVDFFVVRICKHIYVDIDFFVVRICRYIYIDFFVVRICRYIYI